MLLLILVISLYFIFLLVKYMYKINNRTTFIKNRKERLNNYRKTFKKDNNACLKNLNQSINDFEIKKKTLFKNLMILLAFFSTTIFTYIYCFHAADVSKYFEEKILTEKTVLHVFSSKLDTESWSKVDSENFEIWRRLLEENLMFNCYKEKTDTMTQKGVEILYADLIRQCNISAMIEDDRILHDINYFISAGVLPHATESIYEINALIDQYPDKKKVPIILYQKELVIRVRRQMQYPSKTNAYQAARAADDILEIKKTTNSCSYEELVLYTALSVNLYSLAVTYPEGSDKLDQKMNYRPAVLYTALFQQTYEQKIIQASEELKINQEHFLLCAYSFFKYAIELSSNPEKELSDIDYYMSYVLYYQIVRYGYDEKCKECAFYTNKYLNSSLRKEKYIDSCNFIRKRLIEIDPELATYFTN